MCVCVHASIQKHTDFSSVSVAGKLSGQAIARDCSDRGSASRNRFADTPPYTLAQTVCVCVQERWCEGRPTETVAQHAANPQDPQD